MLWFDWYTSLDVLCACFNISWQSIYCTVIHWLYSQNVFCNSCLILCHKSYIFNCRMQISLRLLQPSPNVQVCPQHAMPGEAYLGNDWQESGTKTVRKCIIKKFCFLRTCGQVCVNIRPTMCTHFNLLKFISEVVFLQEATLESISNSMAVIPCIVFLKAD